MSNKYIGMTVNERLYVSGLMNEFDIAVKKKNGKTIISILKKVEIIDKKTIEQILIQLGITPLS